MGSEIPECVDVVVVGGGIAGAALGTVLARDGLQVLVLERELVHRDRVRGETVQLWGVEEIHRLGLEPAFLDAGGHYASTLVPYDEVHDQAEAEAAAVPLDQILPGIAGNLNVGYPEACESLLGTAAAVGATVLRGVTDVDPAEGLVGYAYGGVRRQARCRLIVGADGRRSAVRRALGVPVHRTPARTMGGGMLVDGLDGWPADRIAIGTEHDLHYFVFARAEGRVRLLMMHLIGSRGRFAGPDGAARFLAAWRLRCLPDSDRFAAARPAGPCAFFPMDDGIVPTPFGPGAVLVGDAAGWNDPVIGQGLAIALRDARMVADAVRAESTWTSAMFEPYAQERRERMRRLQLCAELHTDLNMTFTPIGATRRKAWGALWPQDPVLGGPTLAIVIGPEKVAPESFDPANLARVRAVAA